jgi:hypothetical protein
VTQEPIYMEPQALQFIRAWPDIPEKLQALMPRFINHGFLWADPNVDIPKKWIGSMRLTETGERLKELCDAQTFNFFVPSQLKEILPQGYDPSRLDRIFKDRLAPVRNYRAAPATAQGSGLREKLVQLGKAVENLKYKVAADTYAITADDADIPF